MPRKEDDSLGQDFTRMGEEESPKPSDTEQSLGGQSTFGDAGSSASDVRGLDDAFDSDMEVVDLSSRYEIEGVLGKGGMGEVLRARDKRLDRPVAIKRVLGEMARSKKALDRFLTEAQSVAKLNHFSIVQIYDYGRATDGPFIIMELVEGQSLQEKLKEGPLDLQAAVDMTCQLCDALSVAHEAGITHRDIKPANILLTGRGEPKLTDFGLARQETADHGQTMAGAVLGTIDFMPPEQRRDATQTDARSDLWSLAATLYQMVTGKSPKIIRFNNVPQALQDVLGKALEDEKEDRYQTAAEFRDALRDSLTASAPAPEVAVDLSAGECPQCHEKNEASRKFCKGCGESLRSPCLKCEQEIAVWEKFCPECGVDLPELIETRQTELEQQKQQIESLRREYDYDQALSLAGPIKELSDTRFKEYQVWAEEMIQTLETEYAEQGSGRDNVVSEAQVTFDNHRYDDVIKLLDGIAVPLRDDAVTSLLREAQSRQQETQDLLAKIKERVASRDIDGLWEDTSRFLELNPGHKQVSDLDQKLQERRQKREKQTTALLERAEAAYVSHQDKEVLGLLEKWPPGVKQPDRVGQLLELAQARDEQATNLRQEIQAAVTAKSFDGVLPKVEEYATLRPNDDSVAQLREQLLGHEEIKPPEIIVTKEVSKRPVTGSVGKDSQRNRNVLLLAGGVGGIVLLVFLFAIFSSGRKAADDSVSDARLPTTPSKEPQERESDAPAERPVTPPPTPAKERKSGPPAERPVTPSSTPPKVSTDEPALAAAPLTESEAKQHQQDWAEYLETEVEVSNSVGVQLRLIPPGEFQMGSPASEAGREDDETQHRVQITKPFYLSVREVTQEQYEDVMGENPSCYSALGEAKSYVSGIETSHFPVENASWNDAVELCRRLSAREGAEYRLPTEAEWEYACRAGTTTAYSSREDRTEVGEYTWHKDNSKSTTHAVGQKLPNAWGLYDMHGNVWEWCWDWHAAYGSENVVIDPTGPASGEHRVLRGGSFWALPRDVRSANRYDDRPDYRSNAFGFRLARTISGVGDKTINDVGAPVDEPETPSSTPAKSTSSPGNLPVGVINPPTYASAELGESLTASNLAFRQLLDFDGTGTPEEKAAKKDFYNQSCDLALKVTFVDPSGLAVQVRVDAVHRLLKEVGKHPRQVKFVGEVAALWHALKGRPSDGILLAGTVAGINRSGSLHESTIILQDDAATVVTVLSTVDPTDNPISTYHSGSRVLILGSVIDDPASAINGYDGPEPVVIWAGYPVELAGP